MITTEDNNIPKNNTTEKSTIRRIFSKRMMVCILLGFSSGLPLYLLINLVQVWLKDSGLDLKTIGLFALVTFPYVWKFVWAPFLDRYSLFRLGRRRGWMIFTQVTLLVLMSLLGFLEPGKEEPIISLFNINLSSLQLVMGICFLISFFSATQDIALDAYRREILDDIELGLGNSLFVNAYRIAGMIPGGLSLILSNSLPWNVVFIITSFFMLPGIITSLYIKEPTKAPVPRTLLASIVEPFIEFFTRKKFWGGVTVIAFIFLYKFGDNMATALASLFYKDIGFLNKDIGYVQKGVGLWCLIIGGIFGGIWMLKIGINKALWIFGVGQIITILGFFWLAHAYYSPDCMANFFKYIGLESWAPYFAKPNTLMLAIVVGAESLGAGLGTVCYIAYMCRETNPSYVATQLALFTALSAIPRTLCTSFVGYLVEPLGWENFFILCFALAIPGMLMLIKVAPYREAIKK